MMNRTFFTALFILTCAFCTLHSLPAFPGAEGWGTETAHGRGGRVLLVTNTNSTGAGSLRAAMNSTGPRIIVFQVSGVIDLGVGYQRLTSANSEFYIAGQTSPGGVTLVSSLRNLSQSIIMCYNPCGLHDFVMRFLRFRGKEYNMDGYTMAPAYNFVFDHCDFSGGQDETFDLCHCYDFTTQWCTVANSSVCTGCQTFGALIGYEEMTHVTIHHMLYAHHKNRGGPAFHFGSAPVPVDFGQIDYSNNVSYNIGQSGFYVSYTNTLEFHVNLVGNYLKWGPDSRPEVEKLISLSGAHVYNNGNCAYQQNGSVTSDREYGSVQVTAPWNMPAITTTSAAQAYEDVCNWVGAFPRDPMNTRTIQEVRTMTGTYGKTDDAMITSGPAAPADADMDGMPDFWETAMGFNPNDSAGKNADHDGDGYTNIEEYLNDLALARLCQDYYNPVYPIPSDWPDYDPACCKSLAVNGYVSETGRPLNSLQVGPNPCLGGSISIRPSAARGEVRILDVRGREIFRASASEIVRWAGTDRNGLRVSPGVYMIRWTDNGNLLAHKPAVIAR